MKSKKKEILLNGNLVGTLETGKNALVYSGGKIYHTSYVIKIYEQTKEKIHFETMGAHYYLIIKPAPAAEVNIFPAMGLAA